MARDRDLIIDFFREFDDDQSGHISKKELASTLCQLDPARWNDDTIADLFTSADVNQDGVIDYAEFVAWITGGDPRSRSDKMDQIRLTHAAVRASRLNGQQVADVFQHYDPHVSLDKAAFVNLWQGLEISADAAEAWFEAVDVNRSGSVSFKELMTALILCSGEEDINATASMLMKVHSTNGVCMSSLDFTAAITESVNVMKATFYPALKELLMTETTPDGARWADVFIENQRYDMGSPVDASDDEMLDLALRTSIYPEAIFDSMLEGLSEQFSAVDCNQDSLITLEELGQGLERCVDLKQIMFPQHAVRAMLSSFAGSL